MKILILMLQIVLSVVVVASAMPVLMATVPPVREGALGGVVAAGALGVVFFLIRLAWPRRAR